MALKSIFQILKRGRDESNADPKTFVMRWMWNNNRKKKAVHIFHDRNAITLTRTYHYERGRWEKRIDDFIICSFNRTLKMWQVNELYIVNGVGSCSSPFFEAKINQTAENVIPDLNGACANIKQNITNRKTGTKRTNVKWWAKVINFCGEFQLSTDK